MRSSWKGIISMDLFKFKNDNFIGVPKNFIKNKYVISNNKINEKFTIYNGKFFDVFLTKRESVGFKIGEFVFTRKAVVSHKKKLQKSGTRKLKK